MIVRYEWETIAPPSDQVKRRLRQVERSNPKLVHKIDSDTGDQYLVVESGSEGEESFSQGPWWRVTHENR